MILQPYAGIDFAAADMPALGLFFGRGADRARLSARLATGFAEPFAPYVGLSYNRLLGRTARIARLAGENPDLDQPGARHPLLFLSHLRGRRGGLSMPT